jgi:hypothetical protein
MYVYMHKYLAFWHWQCCVWTYPPISPTSWALIYTPAVCLVDDPMLTDSQQVGMCLHKVCVRKWKQVQKWKNYNKNSIWRAKSQGVYVVISILHLCYDNWEETEITWSSRGIISIFKLLLCYDKCTETEIEIFPGITS